MELKMLRVNRYVGTCLTCRTTVPAGAGWTAVVVTNDSERWRTFCSAHKPDATTQPTPTPEEATPMPYDSAVTDTQATPSAVVTIDNDMLDKAVASIARQVASFAATDVPALVKATMLELTRNVTITVGKTPPIKLDQSHYMLPTILQAIVAGASPFLVGPAGSGKTTLAEQIAKVLKLKFYMAARVTSEFKLLGFINAQGVCVRTAFREAYEHGGAFLFDEMDASDPDVPTTFNAALANGYCDFPDGMVKRHKDFVAIAAGNTYGRGADRQYVGRNQLDAATLDRFVVFDIDYDEALELQLAGNADWAKYVQAIRKAVDAEKVRHIVSPRASITGARLLACGMDRPTVCNAVIWKGLPQDARQRVEQRALSFWQEVA